MATNAPTPAAMQGVSGEPKPGSSSPGKNFSHHFAHPTCFNTAPVRRRRLAGAGSGSLGTVGSPGSQRSSDSSSSPTPPLGSMGSFSGLSSTFSTSPATSVSFSSSNDSARGTPNYSHPPSFTKGPKRQTSAPSASSTQIRSNVDLTNHYRNYVRALNTRTVESICRYISKKVNHNGTWMGTAEFCSLIPPGAIFMPEDIICDIPGRTVAARLYIEYPCTTGRTAIWGMHPYPPNGAAPPPPKGQMPFDQSEAPASPDIAERGRSARRICQVDEMVFYHFDEDWRIQSVHSMISPRQEGRRRSGSDHSYRERSNSKSN